MKKAVSFMVLTGLLLLVLSACSASGEMNGNSERDTKKSPTNYKGTLDIGSEFYASGRYQYIYGGIVNDSILINVNSTGIETATTLAFYIPITREEPVVLPYNKSATILINEADKEKGTASITLTTH